jgi:hypothetical protein
MVVSAMLSGRSGRPCPLCTAGTGFALLTTLTVLSVAVDAYSYVRDEDPLIVGRPLRSITLLLMLAACVVIFVNRSRPRR